MTDAPDIAALMAMKALNNEPKVAIAHVADEPKVLPPLTTDDLPKLSVPDELRADSSAPPSNDPEAKPSSSPSSSPISSPAPQPLAASTRPSWMSSRNAIVAGVLLALVMVLVAMRMFRH